MTKKEIPEDRRSKIDSAIAAINKDQGKNTVMWLSSQDVQQMEHFSSGSYGLNKCLGIGGYPKGRIIEAFGPESSGKTTLALHAIAEVQKQGGVAAFVDAEHALDPTYAAALGVDMDNVIISQPDNGEQALEVVDQLTGIVDLIVVDSVAALTPKAELEGDMGASHMGLQARLMGQALRKLVAKVHKTKTTVFFINQIRSKIGVMFGSPETTSGGNALKYYCSVRLDIRRIGKLGKGEDSFGNRTRVKVIKNKVAPPMKECEFDILFGEGINYAGEILDAADTLGIVDRAGAWYSYEESRIGQGRDNVLTFLSENPKVLAEIVAKVNAA